MKTVGKNILQTNPKSPAFKALVGAKISDLKDALGLGVINQSEYDILERTAITPKHGKWHSYMERPWRDDYAA